MTRAERLATWQSLVGPLEAAVEMLKADAQGWHKGSLNHRPGVVTLRSVDANRLLTYAQAEIDELGRNA